MAVRITDEEESDPAMTLEKVQVREDLNLAVSVCEVTVGMMALIGSYHCQGDSENKLPYQDGIFELVAWIFMKRDKKSPFLISASVSISTPPLACRSSRFWDTIFKIGTATWLPSKFARGLLYHILSTSGIWVIWHRVVRRFYKHSAPNVVVARNSLLYFRAK